MSNIENTEQSRINNKVSEIENDIRIKFPNPVTSPDAVVSNPLLNLQKISPDQSLENSKINLSRRDVDTSRLYTTLDTGERVQKFDSFVDGVNEEQRLALTQDTSDKWLNGIAKFGTKTATSIIGGTLGTAYGVVEAIKDGSTQSLWNNDFNKYLDNLNTQLDYQLPNYYTEQEKEAGFLESTTSANFWANDFLGGLSFTLGTIVSEGIWAAATGGSSLVVKGARAGLRAANTLGKTARAADNIKDVSKGIKNASKLTKEFLKKSALDTKSATDYGKAIQALNTARFTYTSAGYEAGVEARQYIKEQKENFQNNFERINGYPPTIEDLTEFNKNLDQTANTLFSANVALVGSSNLAILGKMYNVGSPIKAPKSFINKKLFGVGVEKTKAGTFESIKRTTTQKALGTTYSIFKAPIIEGVWEEGMQAVSATSAEAFLEAQYNNQKDSIDLIGALYEGMSETYGTKEGWKEIGLGMLIGLVGGQVSNIASGQGAFSDISNLKKRDEVEAKARTLYSSEKVVDEILKSSVINKATQVADQAQQRNDLTTESLADSMAIISNVMMAEKFDYGNEAQDDLFTAVDLISEKSLRKQFGELEEGAVEELKDNIKRNYTNIKDSYKKNREFAEYSIGEQDLPEGYVNNVSQARDMLAYQLTMSEKVEDIADDYLAEIKKEVLSFSGNSTNYESALDMQNALLKTTVPKRREYTNLKRRYNRAKKRIDLAEKKSRAIENQILVREEAGSLAKDLDINNRRIQELQEEIENTRQEIELFSDSIMLSSPFREDIDLVRTSDLVDIDSLLDDLQDNLQAVEKANPAQAARLRRLTDEYKKAMYIYSQYGEIVQGLLNPKLGLKGKSRTFLNRTKSQNQVTLDFLQSLKTAREGFEEIQSRFETTTEVPNSGQSPKDDIAKKQTTEQTEQVNIDPVEVLRNKLKVLLDTNSYLLDYFGEDLESSKPTVEDIQTFESLVDKYQDKDINILINVDPDRLSNTARGGLSIEEIEQYQNLAEKLANWKLLDGVQEEGISILDILNQIDSLETEVKPTSNVVDETTPQEDVEIALNTKQVDRAEEQDPSLFQTFDSVVVAQDSKHTQIAHLNLESFLDYGASIKDGNGNLVADIESVQKKVGSSFIITINNVSIPVKIVEHSRLLFKNEAFNNLLNQTGLKVVDMKGVEGSRWTMVYKPNEDGSYDPLLSDFKIDDSEEGFTSLSPEGLYDTELGSTIFYKLSLNNSWNKGLQREVRNLDKSDPAKVKKLKDKIRNQVLVYGTNENNSVVGVMKAANSKSTNQVFLTIRQKAAEALYQAALDNSNTETVFTLPFSTPVEKIYTGMANMKLVPGEGNTLVPQKNNISERSLSMIESFGFAQNGQIIQNPNNEVNLGEVNTQFIENLEGNRPVVVVRYQKQNIAYPITVLKRDSNLYDSVVTVLQSRGNSSTKVSNIAKLLAENGVDPKQYNLIETTDISFIGSEDQSRLLQDIQELKQPISAEEFLSENYKKESLITDASITIDLENRPFLNPKMKVDYSFILPNEDSDNVEQTLFNKTGFAPRSTKVRIANQIAQNKSNTLSPYEQNVLSLHADEIREIVKEQTSLTPEKQREAISEKNKKCITSSKKQT